MAVLVAATRVASAGMLGVSAGTRGLAAAILAEAISRTGCDPPPDSLAGSHVQRIQASRTTPSCTTVFMVTMVFMDPALDTAAFAKIASVLDAAGAMAILGSTAAITILSGGEIPALRMMRTTSATEP